MEVVIDDLSSSNGTLINYVKGKIASFNEQEYSGFLVDQRKGLLVQLEMLEQAQRIKDKSGPLKELIETYSQAQNESEKPELDERKQNSIELRTEKLKQPHFPNLLMRLEHIKSLDFSEATSAVKKSITDITTKITTQDKNELANWEIEERTVQANAMEKWRKKWIKCFTNEEKYVDKLTNTWKDKNPKPVPTKIDNIELV
jgi:hypothetical protein